MSWSMPGQIPGFLQDLFLLSMVCCRAAMAMKKCSLLPMLLNRAQRTMVRVSAAASKPSGYYGNLYNQANCLNRGGLSDILRQMNVSARSGTWNGFFPG